MTQVVTMIMIMIFLFQIYIQTPGSRQDGSTIRPAGNRTIILKTDFCTVCRACRSLTWHCFFFKNNRQSQAFMGIVMRKMLHHGGEQKIETCLTNHISQALVAHLVGALSAANSRQSLTTRTVGFETRSPWARSSAAADRSRGVS